MNTIIAEPNGVSSASSTNSGPQQEQQNRGKLSPKSVGPKLVNMTIRQIIEEGGPQTFGIEQEIMWKAVMDRLSTIQGIEEIVQEYCNKEGQQRRRNRSRSLLALTIERHAPSRVILAILKAYPQAASKPQQNGMLPIHLACQHGSSLEIVLALLVAYPNGIKRPTQYRSRGDNVKEEDGWLPIHFAIKATSHDNISTNTIDDDDDQKDPVEVSINVVKTLLEIYPESASQPIRTKRQEQNLLPIHFACQMNAPVKVIQALLRTYPQGVREPLWILNNAYGCSRTTCYAKVLPLHIAVSHSQPSFKTINVLLEEYPEGVCELGYSTRTTVMHFALRHISFSSSSSIDVTMRILQACPSVAAKENAHGSLPLHLACDNHSQIIPSSIVFALLDAYPNGAQHANRNGSLPLHLACKTSCSDNDGSHDNNILSEQIIRKLLQVHPKAAQHQDSNGQLPLHVALCGRHSPNLSIIKLLVEHYPRGLQVLVGKYTQQSFNRPRNVTPLSCYLLSHPNNPSKCIIEYLVDMTYPKCENSSGDESHFFNNFPETKRQDVQLWPKFSSLPLTSNKCNNSTKNDILDRIYTTISKKVSQQETNWLHRAAAGGAPLDVMTTLMKLYPHQIDNRDSRNENCHFIHFTAIAKEPQLDVIQLFCQRNPSAVKLKDNWGRLPLHFVLQNPSTNSKTLSSKIEVAQYMLQEYPSAAIMVDNVTGLLPFQSACLNLITPPNQTEVTITNQSNSEYNELKKTELLLQLLKLYPAGLSFCEN